MPSALVAGRSARTRPRGHLLSSKTKGARASALVRRRDSSLVILTVDESRCGNQSESLPSLSLCYVSHFFLSVIPSGVRNLLCLLAFGQQQEQIPHPELRFGIRDDTTSEHRTVRFVTLASLGEELLLLKKTAHHNRHIFFLAVDGKVQTTHVLGAEASG